MRTGSLGLLESICTRVLSSLKVGRESRFPSIKGARHFSFSCSCMMQSLNTEGTVPTPMKIKQHVKHGDRWPSVCV